MNPTLVQTKLTEVLEEIQALSGEACPPITGTTKPLEELPKFDSKIWPVAIGMLAERLGITIAHDVNIFSREKGCVALTIDETVAMVVELANAEPITAAQEVNTR
jgi:hypothetical protein